MKAWFSSLWTQAPPPPQTELRIEHGLLHRRHALTGFGFSLFRIQLMPSSSHSDRVLLEEVARAEEAQIAAFSALERTQLIATARREPGGVCRVALQDTYQNKEVKALHFKREVHRLLLRKTVLVVCFFQEIWVYAVLPFELKETMKTQPNPRALFAYSQKQVLLAPAEREDQLQVCFLKPEVRKTLQPFDRPYGAFALAPQGNLVAVADQEGCEVRVLDAFSGNLKHSLRRGMNACQQASLALSSSLVAMASERGTLHVWELAEEQQQQHPSSEQEEQEKSMMGKGLQLLEDFVTVGAGVNSTLKIKLQAGVLPSAIGFVSQEAVAVASGSGEVHVYQVAGRETQRGEEIGSARCQDWVVVKS